MFERRRTKRSGKVVRVSMLMVFLGLVIMVMVVYNLYCRVFVTNVSLEGHRRYFISQPVQALKMCSMDWRGRESSKTGNLSSG